MAVVDIKKLAKNLYDQRLLMSLEAMEEILQNLYEEGIENCELNKLKGSYPDNTTFNPQKHYDNSKGSLYKIAKERSWNAYQFDIIKRIDRAEKKDQFESDLNKTIDVIKIWKHESKQSS